MSTIFDWVPAFWVSVLTAAAINGVITFGLYFSNSAGALSVAHAAIAGMAGYLAAVLTTNFGWPFPVALLAGALLGWVTGMLLALVTLRMHELVAGLTTLAFGETMVIVAFNLDYIGGANGFVGIPLRTTLPNAWLMLLLVALAAWRFDGSRLGYAARACRDNAVTAAAMGIHVPRVKTLVFAAGGAIAGLGGGLRAHYILVQNAEDLGFFMSVNYVIFWVFGGSHTFWGALFGALSLTIIPELLRFSLYERYILYGAVVTAVLLVRPAGIVTRPRMGTRWGVLDRLAAMRRR